jgi:SAM-dependent methyltransferase
MEISVQIQNRLTSAETYNRWIYRNISPYVKNRVLDVGCSIGNITKFFLDREAVIGLDKSSEAIRIISENFAGRGNFKAVNLSVTDPAIKSLAAYDIDTIVCLNCLEHIEDDEAALANLNPILGKDGRLIILVPVIKALFGSVDKNDDHYRRYSRAEINKKLKNAGFYVKRQFYMNLIGIIGWYINGKILKNDMIPVSHYSLYDRLVPLIARMEEAVRPPIGLSLISVCGKKL